MTRKYKTEEGDFETRENGRFLTIIRAKMNYRSKQDNRWKLGTHKCASQKQQRNEKCSNLQLQEIFKIVKTRKMKKTLKVYL